MAAQPTVLLADDWSFDKLLNWSGLPPELFVNGEATDVEGRRLTHDASRIVRYDPTPFYPDATGKDRFDCEVDSWNQLRPAERRIQFLGRLMGCRVVHVAVLHNPEAQLPGLSRDQQIVLQQSTHLEALHRWYEHFDEEVKRHLAKHHGQYIHFLALVCAEELTKDHLPALRQLLWAPGEQKVLDQVYLMFQMVEMGKAITGVGDPQFARKFWPVYVGRLLLRVLHAGADEQLNDPARTFIKTWRALSFQYPEDVLQAALGQREKAIQDTYQKVKEPDRLLGPPRFAVTIPAPESEDEALPLPGLPKDTHWSELDAAALIKKVSDPDYAAEAIREKGGEFRGTLARFRLGDGVPLPGEPQAGGTEPLRSMQDSVGAWWKAIDRDYRQVNQPLAPVQFTPPPDDPEPDAAGQPAFARRWQRVCDDEQAWADELRRTKELAAPYDEARLAHVNWWEYTRLLMLPILLLNGYVAFVITKAVLQLWAGAGLLPKDSWLVNFGGPLLIAVAGAAGCILAAILTIKQEDTSGRVSRDRLLAQLGVLQKRLQARHQDLLELLRWSCTDWVRQQCLHAYCRTHALLSRLQTVFNHELQPENFRRSAAPGRAEGPLAADQCLVVSLKSRPARANGQQVVCTDEIRTFNDQWQKLSAEHDRRNRGHLPVALLMPLLRDFREAVNNRVIKSLAEESKGVVEELMAGVGAQDHAYDGFSCQLPAQDTGKHLRLLLVPRGFKDYCDRDAQHRDVTVQELQADVAFRGLAYLCEEIIIEDIQEEMGLLRVHTQASSHGSEATTT